MQRGTLYHLRNLINHRNVTNKCMNNMNACEDIFETVVEGHVIACALQLLGMSGVNDLPTQTITSHEAWMMDDIERRRILMDTATQIVVICLPTFHLRVQVAMRYLLIMCMHMHVRFLV